MHLMLKEFYHGNCIQRTDFVKRGQFLMIAPRYRYGTRFRHVKIALEDERDFYVAGRRGKSWELLS